MRGEQRLQIVLIPIRGQPAPIGQLASRVMDQIDDHLLGRHILRLGALTKPGMLLPPLMNPAVVSAVHHKFLPCWVGTLQELTLQCNPKLCNPKLCNPKLCDDDFYTQPSWPVRAGMTDAITPPVPPPAHR
jgi:hypothetical protein